jgi:DNA-3-methyladenine glycosylase II
VATIETVADIRAGTLALRQLCPDMRRIHDLVGDPPLRRSTGGFAGLAQVVVAQQLSTASANAIWARTAAAVDPFEPRRLLAAREVTLRGAGLSAGKVRTLRAVAEAIVAGELAIEAAPALAEADLRKALLAVKGIGPWSADIYMMFCLGHADAFAPGDLALQVSAQRALRLGARPTAAELEAIAERWRPWRGVAARMLWAYYKADDPSR